MYGIKAPKKKGRQPGTATANRNNYPPRYHGQALLSSPLSELIGELLLRLCCLPDSRQRRNLWAVFETVLRRRLEVCESGESTGNGGQQ